MCAVLLRVSVPALLIYHVDERQPREVAPDVLREGGHLALRRTLVLVEHCRKDSSAFAELPDNGFGQVLMNLIVTGNRLRPLRFAVGVPIVACPTADQYTTDLLQLPYEVASFQSAKTNSSTFRMYGISPDSRSASRSLRWLTNSCLDIPWV